MPQQPGSTASSQGSFAAEALVLMRQLCFIFASHDKDNSGYLDQDELVKTFQQVYKEASVSRSEQKVRKVSSIHRRVLASDRFE